LKLIIDTNIVFSLLLKHNLDKKIFEYDLYSPKDLVIELFKYKSKIEKFSKNKNLQKSYEFLIRKVVIIDERFIPDIYLKKSYELIKDIDIKDLHFVALSLYIKAPLLTGDKKLIDGLKSKGFLDVISLNEI